MYNNSITYDWQTSSDFVFSAKSNTAAKYTITFSLSFCIRIHKKKSDGTTGEFIRWSPPKTVTTTRDIWIVGIDKIMVKPANSPDMSYIDSPTEVVALVGTQHTFKVTRTPTNAPAWPSGKPKWTLKTFSEDNQPIVYSGIGDIMNFSANGVTLLDETLTFECGNKKTVKLINIMPTLESVDFKNGGIQTITDVGLEPEWKKAGVNGQGARSEPFCVVKNRLSNIIIKLNASKNLTFATTVTLQEHESLYSLETVTWQNWPINTYLVRTSPNDVRVYALTYKWEYSTDSGQKWRKFADSNHDMYVTWAQKLCPDTDFTKEHIHYACTNANLATTITNSAVYNPVDQNYVFASGTGVVNKTVKAVDNNPGHGVGGNSMIMDWNAWRFYARKQPGDCGTLASLAGASLQLLGIPATAPLLSFPTIDNPITATSCQNQTVKKYQWTHLGTDGKPHTKEIDIVLTYPGNNYEGFLAVNDQGVKAFTVYPPNGPFMATTTNYNNIYLAILRSVATKQHWQVKGIPRPIPPNHDPCLPMPKPLSESCCNRTLSPGTIVEDNIPVP